MRVLQILTNIVDLGPFLTELSSALVEKGAEVHCVCSMDALWGSSRKLVELPVQIHDMAFARGMNPVSHIRAARRLNSLVLSIHPDIVHAHFSATILTTAMARTRLWPPTIGTFHGVGFLLMSGVKARILKIAETWAASALDEAWVLNEEDRIGLSRAAPTANVKKQRSLGLGCNLEKFNFSGIPAAERHFLLTELGLTEEHRIFAFVGRFVNFKGFDVTVRAFQKLAKIDPATHLLLIGARDPLHPAGLTRAEEEALRNSSQITDVGWQTEVQRYLAITNVVVFPSQREGVPVCLMEALAMGVPVITWDTRGCRDVVRDRVDGLVLQDHTVDNLFTAMKLLAENETLRQQFAAEALAGRGRLDRLNYVREQIEVYEQLCSSRKTYREP